MREVEFRAWDTEEKVMIYNVEQTYDDNCRGKGGCYGDCCFGEVLEDSRYILGQYTGLKDKNGKKIYEGDIVHYVSEDIDEITEIGFEDRLLAYAMYSHEGNYLFGYEPSSVFEVIGNIYENKELVEYPENLGDD